MKRGAPTAIRNYWDENSRARETVVVTELEQRKNPRLYVVEDGVVVPLVDDRRVGFAPSPKNIRPNNDR